MKTFNCGNCGHTVYFENVSCVRCDHSLGFSPELLSHVTLHPVDASVFRCLGDDQQQAIRYCGNAVYGACNWVVPAGHPGGYCRACELNRTIPNLSEWGNLAAWSEIERAKKRLVYSLLRFNLPLNGVAPGKAPLVFDFVRDAVTSHLEGVITIDIMEADAVQRERQRQQLDEPYRTLLGHLRHESGHYFWMQLIDGSKHIADFRRLFGDETDDYTAALARHRLSGPPADWQARYVSAYASAHPWEDWAETWAHYLHMVDALDTADAEGLEPAASGFLAIKRGEFDAYRALTLEALLKRWIDLTVALNSLNRSMGHSDFYPFVIPRIAFAKLEFIHWIIRNWSP